MACLIEAKLLEYDCPPTPKPREERKPTQITPNPYSNFLEPTVPTESTLKLNPAYLDTRGTLQVGLVMGHLGLAMGCYGGLYGIMAGLTKSTDHPSRPQALKLDQLGVDPNYCSHVGGKL